MRLTHVGLGTLMISALTACAVVDSAGNHSHGWPVADDAPGHIGPQAASAPVAEAPATPAAAEPAPPPPAPTEFTDTLPGGFALKGNLDGIEGKLIAFIKDPAKVVDKTTWFTFDRLLFQTGKADLDMDKSKDQLTNIAEILKAYPKLELKIGGYTDNVGKPQGNKVLSQKRADNVAAAIVAMGVDKARLGPEGYGEEHPVCAANDTDACKAQNRRIDVRVKAK